MLANAWDANGNPKSEAPPLHIYESARTLCGRKVPRNAYGWFETGVPLDDPAFPLRPICPECSAKTGQSGREFSDAPDSSSTGDPPNK